MPAILSCGIPHFLARLTKLNPNKLVVRSGSNHEQNDGNMLRRFIPGDRPGCPKTVGPRHDDIHQYQVRHGSPLEVTRHAIFVALDAKFAYPEFVISQSFPDDVIRRMKNFQSNAHATAWMLPPYCAARSSRNP